MWKEITKVEIRLALSLLNVINESDKEIRKDVVIDYVLNALGLEMVVKAKELSEFLEADISEVETKKAIKTFKEDKIENIKMTFEEAIMQTEDLLNNLENEEITEIDVNDIRALKFWVNKAETKVFFVYGDNDGELTLKKAENKLEKLIKRVEAQEIVPITKGDIEAMHKLMYAKVLYEPINIKLKAKNAIMLKSELEKLEEYSIIKKGDYTNLDITIG